MNDDQLRDELERRANRGAVPDMLPAVAARLDVRQNRLARVARWAPLAGLTGAGIIVIALVIAWPRGSSVGPAPSATSVAGTTVQCLLDGADTQLTISDETGLISSCTSIRIDALPSPATDPQSPTTTLVLRLEGSPCGITAPLRFTHEADHYSLRSTWTGGICVSSEMDAAIRLDLRAPIDRSAVSVLLDDAAATAAPTSNFDCGGRITVNDHSKHMTLCIDAGEVDEHSQDPAVSNPDGDLHTVHVRWGLSESLTTTTIDVYKTSDGAYSVSVVTGVSSDSAFRPSAHAVDLVLDEPVSAATVTLHTYTGTDASTPSPSPPSQASTAATELSCGDTTTVLDPGGLIASCVATPGGGINNRGLIVTSTGITATWFRYGCIASVQATLAQVDGTLSLEIVDEPVPWHSAEPTCAGGLGEETLSLSLLAPIAGNVSATVDGQDLPEIGVPPHKPNELTCADGVTLTDTTGVVLSCSDAGVVDYHSQDPKLSNPGGDPTKLHLWWGSDTCVVDRRIAFGGGPDSYVATVTETDLVGCSPAPEAYSVDLQLSAAIDASSVRVRATSPHSTFTPTSKTIECAPFPGASDSHVTFTDETGAVASCSGVASTGSADGQVSNPDGNLTELLLDWSDGSCDRNPLITLAKLPTSYLLQYRLGPECLPSERHPRTLLLHLNQTIDASSDFSHEVMHGS